jgi:hypothetical protein
LQVFSKACCKRLFKMFHIFPDVCWNHFSSRCAYVATVYFQMFLSYAAAGGLMFQVRSVLLWMFYVFHTHIAKACFQMFNIFSILCYIHVLCVLYCSAGASQEPADGVATIGARWGVLVLSCSSRLLSAARAEREEGSGATGGCTNKGGVRMG